MLPKTAEYALRAIVLLSRVPGQAKSADSLAETAEVPRRYLYKVLQDLVRANLLRSQSGPGGGYRLARSPAEISLLDVVNAVAPVDRIKHCPLSVRSHLYLCPLQQQLDEVYATIETALSKVTIAPLVRSVSSIPPLCEVEK
jgi:Rrf2 family protein